MKIRIGKREIAVLEFVKRYELEPIVVEAEESSSWLFVIDIYRLSGETEEYFPKVYRRELFRLRPTFTLGGRAYESDEEILVDDAGSWEEIRASKPDDVLQAVIGRIVRQFGGSDGDE